MPINKKKFDGDNRPFLTSVTLGGFQVFEDPTTIPLGWLTFLFGPNSAGKSALEDGLFLLSRVAKDGHMSAEDTDTLHQHWRRGVNGYSPLLIMGLTASISTNLRISLDVPNEDRGSDYAIYPHEISITLRYEYCEEARAADDELPGAGSFELGLNGIPLLELDECNTIGVNFGHPILEGFILGCDYDDLSQKVPKFVSYSDGWVRLKAVFVWMHQKKNDHTDLLRGFEFSDKWVEPHSEHYSEFGEPLRAAVTEVTNFFYEIRDVVMTNMTIAFNAVPASRTVPSRKDLTFLFSEDDPLLSDDSGLPLGDPWYRNLAKSCLAKRFETSDIKKSAPNGFTVLVDTVNRALSDHLFLDRGYQISSDCRTILPLEELDTLHVLSAKYIADKPCLVRIFLKDSEGTALAFDQVGSGLGYVLPVLCSVADPHIKISLIQQAELHLHPALQAALGDLLIECTNDEHQIIIETHSEHLLLRVLKRIRQTSQGKTQVPELLLSPDDVVVAYFDPKPDGTTTVRRLRISEDGDFLDRWPRGFFTERDEELFDE